MKNQVKKIKYRLTKITTSAIIGISTAIGFSGCDSGYYDGDTSSFFGSSYYDSSPSYYNNWGSDYRYPGIIIRPPIYNNHPSRIIPSFPRPYFRDNKERIIKPYSPTRPTPRTQPSRPKIPNITRPNPRTQTRPQTPRTQPTRPSPQRNNNNNNNNKDRSESKRR